MGSNVYLLVSIRDNINKIHPLLHNNNFKEVTNSNSFSSLHINSFRGNLLRNNNSFKDKFLNNSSRGNPLRNNNSSHSLQPNNNGFRSNPLHSRHTKSFIKM